MDKQAAFGWFIRGMHLVQQCYDNGEGYPNYDKSLKAFNEEWESIEKFLDAANELLANEEDDF